MLDAALLQPLAASLDADGYRIQATEKSGRVEVRITAAEGACADCLVPKEIMRGILSDVLGIPEDAIDVSYPADHAEDPATR